jgi:hypothetical protein
MNLFVTGYRILMTSDVHSVHLSPAQVQTGGQRVGRLTRLYWTIFYTDYFYRKYWDRYCTRLGITMPRSVALAWFAIFAMYREMLRPTLYRAVFALMRLRARLRRLNNRTLNTHLNCNHVRQRADGASQRNDS